MLAYYLAEEIDLVKLRINRGLLGVGYGFFFFCGFIFSQIFFPQISVDFFPADIRRFKSRRFPQIFFPQMYADLISRRCTQI